jgi:hypothetical protein
MKQVEYKIRSYANIIEFELEQAMKLCESGVIPSFEKVYTMIDELCRDCEYLNVEQRNSLRPVITTIFEKMHKVDEMLSLHQRELSEEIADLEKSRQCQTQYMKANRLANDG